VKLLLEGRPGVGKTTVVRGVAERVKEAGMPVAGFLTEEIREGRARRGFSVERFEGERAILAHVDLEGPPRVGRYGVDLAAFERIAVPAIEPDDPDCAVVLDELGKMELHSERFCEAITRLFESDAALLATVQATAHPLTDDLKHRTDIETLQLTRENRNRLVPQIAERMLEAWNSG
jgi:nucleoside-triphosphatase